VSWRCSQAESRRRYLAKFDAAEAQSYDARVGRLGREDEDAYLADLAPVLQLRAGAEVLDAGAGTGAMTSLLSRLPALSITALEPAPAMLAILRSRPELNRVTAVEGFCDAPGDRPLFGAARFDLIVSRQLANGLFDPLVAFRNWHHWLAPGGAVAVVDGLYDRSGWTGAWQEEVDVLPLSACQSTAMVPYLLEIAGFRIDAVRRMEAVNARPSTRTPRYLVVATRRA